MPSAFVTQSVGRAVNKVPGLRRVPVLKLIAVAELALIAREHVARLDSSERRRLIQLVRLGRGRRRNLTGPERDELARLVALMEPRMLAGHAYQKLSPLPLPRRLVYGRRRRP